MNVPVKSHNFYPKENLPDVADMADLIETPDAPDLVEIADFADIADLVETADFEDLYTKKVTTKFYTRKKPLRGG